MSPNFRDLSSLGGGGAHDSNNLRGEVLILSNYYFPEPTGSAPPISDLSFWMAENGYEPQVLTARPSYPNRDAYPQYADGSHDAERIRGVDVTRVSSLTSSSRGVIGRLVSELSFALSALLSRKRKFGGVFCVCPSVFTVLVAPLFVRKSGRLVAVVHDIQSGLASSLKFGLGRNLIAFLRSLEAYAMNRCDCLVALTPAMAGELRAIGVKTPIIVLPPQVDVNEIQPQPFGPDPVAVYSGNLGRKQGLDQVLALAVELRDRTSPIRIIVRGEGSERGDLEREAVRLGLSNLEFRDLVPRSEIANSLAEGVVHLVPQAAMGANFALPSKVFSIMAAARPYVATALDDTPLARITQESGGGVCVPPQDAKRFADAVEALVGDVAMRARLGEAGRQYVERVVDREVVCRRMVDALL